MRRTWWYKPFATLLTLWLPLIVGEPSLLQPCPMHGSAFVVTAAATPITPAPHGEHGEHGEHHHASAPAAMDHSQHHAAAPSHDSAPTHQHHNCSCIGCCAGSPAIVPTFEGPTTTIVVATYGVPDTPVEAAALPRPAPDYSRPYTTGPPRG